MSWQTIAMLVIGVPMILLGSLWSFKERTWFMCARSCVTNCKLLIGGSVVWPVAGIVTPQVGLPVLAESIKSLQRGMRS